MKLIIFVILFLWCFSLTTACQTRIKSPVLEFRPLSKDRRDTLIWFKAYDETTTRYWINEIDSFLKPYHVYETPSTWVECAWNQPPPKDRVCKAKIRNDFYPCGKEYKYGYNGAAACVFLTFSQVPKGWSPVYYNRSSIPVEMPIHLKDHIKQSEEQESHQKVWVDCYGENAADIENIGPINYFPSNGFPANRFLNSHVRGYLPPVIALHFEKSARGILIMVRCRAWAKNIPFEPEDKIGTVHFELLVD